MGGIVPSLLHPVRVRFEPKDDALAVVDGAAAEVVRGSGRGTPYTTPAQVHWEREKDPDPLSNDVVERSTGHVTVRTYDYTKARRDLPRRGDRIVELEAVAVRLYVLRTQPIGHYSAAARGTLLRVYFSDREPTG